jgi:BarA-like signal transduction histidine kinase
MLILVAIVAGLVGLYSMYVVVDSITSTPMTLVHRQQLERAQVIYTIVLLVAAVVFGLTLDNLLP